MKVGAQTFLKINIGIEIKEKTLCLFLFQRKYPEFFNFLFSILQSPFHLNIYAKLVLSGSLDLNFQSKKGANIRMLKHHIFLNGVYAFQFKATRACPREIIYHERKSVK